MTPPQRTIEEASQPVPRVVLDRFQDYIDRREGLSGVPGGGGAGPARPPLPSPPSGAPSLKRDGQIVHPRIWRHQAERARALNLNLSRILRDVLTCILENPEAVNAYRNEQAAQQDRVLEAARAAAARVVTRRMAAVDELREHFDMRRSLPRRANLTWIRSRQSNSRDLRAMDPIDVLELLETR